MASHASDHSGGPEGREFRPAGYSFVDPLDDETATGIARSIAAYGCTLSSLPEESWKTSVCLWQQDRWAVLVDLFSVEEGRSDLVLQVNVYQEPSGFIFKVHFVYVP